MPYLFADIGLSCGSASSPSLASCAWWYTCPSVPIVPRPGDWDRSLKHEMQFLVVPAATISSLVSSIRTFCPRLCRMFSRADSTRSFNCVRNLETTLSNSWRVCSCFSRSSADSSCISSKSLRSILRTAASISSFMLLRSSFWSELKASCILTFRSSISEPCSSTTSPSWSTLPPVSANRMSTERPRPFSLACSSSKSCAFCWVASCISRMHPSVSSIRASQRLMPCLRSFMQLSHRSDLGLGQLAPSAPGISSFNSASTSSSNLSMRATKPCFGKSRCRSF
mmetsp:Transcript_67452/g.158218  ORF Transcript_67452/g.158218 Transcript_67452/m.158218 type:complete len:282 (-) Transcript_67452:152-997(-)